MRCKEWITFDTPTDDDGIHASCDKCGFEKNIGFSSTIIDISRAQSEHDERELPEKDE